MAKARDTGSIFQWNDGSGEGLIWSLSTDTYVSCSRSDVKFRNIKVGDTVSFVKTQDYYTNQFKATDVQRSYSHNIVKQNNPPSSQATPRGILYFQKAYYTQSQMTHIASKFKNHLERAPRVIFSDNYRDYQRKPNQKRLKVGPQAKVVAPYDRSFGFPIPTRFDNSNSYGFINNNHNFQTLIRRLFTKLDKHLRSGGDVIIPAPLESEVNNYKYKSMYFKKGKRVIYHNIGTALLKMDKLLFIQERIDELKLEASDWKVIKGEVNYHNYKLYTAVKQAPQEQVPHAQPLPAPAVGNRRMNNSTGCLVFQTSWYDKTQFERIDAEYKSNYASAPRFLFGDNNQDKERGKWKSRQMFGGQAGVVGKYDRTIGYGIVTTFFGASTPSLYRYKSKMDEQFKPMADHLRKGYDVIVPTPTSTDINKNRRRYYDSRTKKQVIFHNLGTGIALLSMDHIKYIQTKIDELKKIARKVEYAAYYNYDPKTKQLLKSRARPQYPAANRVTVPPREIYNPPNPPREQYNAPPKQHVPPQATSVAHQQLIDQREWQCNLCDAICQGFHNKCNQCQALKGAKKQANVPKQNQVQRPVQPANQMSKQRSGGPPPNTTELQGLYKQIRELQSTNSSLQQKLNAQVSDLQTTNVQLQQQAEMQQKDKDKANANHAEVTRLRQQVGMLEAKLKANEDQNNTKSKQIGILKAQLQDAISENAQSKADQESMMMKMRNEKAEESSTKMDKLRDERDKALDQQREKTSRLLELLEQMTQLGQKNSDLQSKVSELEKLKLQEKVEKVEEQSEISRLSETVKRLEKEVQDKDTKIKQLSNANELNRSTIDGLQRHISRGIADNMNALRLHNEVQKKEKGPQYAMNANDDDANDDEKDWVKPDPKAFLPNPTDNQGSGDKEKNNGDEDSDMST